MIASACQRLLAAVTIVVMSFAMPSCHDIEEFDNNPRGNFEALWTILDTHYCFFAQKEIDWNEVHTRYSARVSDRMTSSELFALCSEMLDELKDGHTNLSSVFGTSYYHNWWSDYPQNFSERLIEQSYFNFNYHRAGGLMFGILPQNIGYVRYSDFSAGIGEGNLDYILGMLAECDGLIIDVRDNGGGELTNVERLCRRFITSRTLAGYIYHKAGPGHDDFSSPYPYYYDPAENGRVMWGKQVAVLTNRSTFSAANNFVSVMKNLPQVKIVGATTGGGSGMPFSSELPNGWNIRFSASPVLDALGRHTEFGVEPSEGCAVDMDVQAALDGHDTILDFAIELLLR